VRERAQGRARRRLLCPEGHRYSTVGLALATNRDTVKAPWLAIRALEMDAAGLDYLAKQSPDHAATSRRDEADGARGAAQRLRAHAAEAQRRLDALDRTESQRA
jgi:hypothetical protein